ncbi:hypothetical protein DFJ73DRAFT_759810 [Zopfochytrium polystomum]|nr:hypothetical protein DFJ73DRAFT_759810 [Zopfochytrium polystomum]
MADNPDVSGNVPALTGALALGKTASQALFYATLAFFFLIGIFAGRKGVVDMDSFLTARGTQGWVGLGLNLFAAGLGVWTIFTLPQVGYDFGVLGAFAYAFACIVPFPVLVLMGKVLRDRAPNGVTITEFVLIRFGWAAQILCNLSSLGYMFVYLISELTALASLVQVFGLDPLAPQIAVCVTTAIYTAIGGMPASLLTDKFQAWFVVGLIILATIAFSTRIQIDPASIPGSAPLQTSRAAWESLWVLTVAVTAANVFHQGYWQRVYAAKSSRDLVRACILAAALTFPVFMLIGFVGIIDVWRNDPNSFDQNAFFDVTATLPVWMNALVLVLAVALVCSSIDTLQSAMSALIVNDIFQSRISLTWARLLTAVLNVPALIVGTKGIPIFTLFLIADLIAAAVVLPVVIGLVRGKTETFFTGLDFAVGCVGGVFSVFLFGLGFGAGDVHYAISLLGLPNGTSVPGESFGVFLCAPAGSVAFMLASAMLRRAVEAALRRDPDARPAAPTLLRGPGHLDVLLGNKEQLEETAGAEEDDADAAAGGAAGDVEVASKFVVARGA